jgi:hypothetical protein
MPNQLLGVLLHTIAFSGLARVSTEFCQLPVIPFLAQHPVQTNRQSTGMATLAVFRPDGFFAIPEKNAGGNEPPALANGATPPFEPAHASVS